LRVGQCDPKALGEDSVEILLLLGQQDASEG